MNIQEFLNRTASRILGDSTKPYGQRYQEELDQIMTLVPLKVYDEASGLYHNRDSVGWALELSPLLGADDKTYSIFLELLTQSIPPNAHLQIIHVASPRVGRRLERWTEPRERGAAIYAEMARHRRNHIQNGVWSSLSDAGPFMVRDYRILMTLALSGKDHSTEKLEELSRLRRAIAEAMKGIGVPTRDLIPTEMLGYLQEIINPSINIHAPRPEWEEMDPLDQQVVASDTSIKVEEGELWFTTTSPKQRDAFQEEAELSDEDYQTERFNVRTFSVKSFPKEVCMQDTSRLIGDFFHDMARLQSPAISVFSLHFPDEQAQNSRAELKTARAVQQAGTSMVKFMPELIDKAEEWTRVRASIKDNDRLVRGAYMVVLYAQDGKEEEAERALRNLYRGNGWQLAREKFVQMGSWCIAVPFSGADGLTQDFEKFKRQRTFLASNVIHLLPLYGEYLGHKQPHMLFIGRRGQIMTFSQFSNVGEGNHNVAVFGKSGAGKSVLLQDMAASIHSAGGRVAIIDDGCSFESSVKIQGGQFVRFTLDAKIGLNPFGMFDAALAESDADYEADFQSFLTIIITQMARPSGVNDTERGVIDTAVSTVFEGERETGTIAMVAAELLRHSEETETPQGKDLAASLSAYHGNGTFADYFAGPTTLQMTNSMTAFEMSDLDAKPELRAIVVFIIMFFIQTSFAKSPRTENKALIIDEAWALLGGGAASTFIEGLARRIRKYGGSLVTGTQKMDDYLKSEGAKAALDNSDWMIIMAQKPQPINDLIDSGKIEGGEGMKPVLRSLKVEERKFSEVMIAAPSGGHFVARLALDPFSAAVYSSKPDTFEKIRQYQAEGFSLVEATRAIAFGRATIDHAANKSRKGERTEDGVDALQRAIRDQLTAVPQSGGKQDNPLDPEALEEANHRTDGSDDASSIDENQTSPSSEPDTIHPDSKPHSQRVTETVDA